ncbi:MAG TPA: RNA polymerase sigma factor [Streptosporangiaceae bacterium]|nr:RNA polymerase sigma factor [Streptosporangiaceae bacterium]
MDTEAVTRLSAAVNAARGGDADAFRALFRDMQPRLLRYLGTLAGDDAEDVASETWLQVARDIGGFEGDYAGFRGWVTTIARHRALDEARRRVRRPAVAVPADDLTALPAANDTAADGIEAVSTAAALRLIATLPPDQAEAVLLRAVIGLDAEAAGRVVGKRAGAVRTAAHRGLRTLARRLAQDGLAQDGLAQNVSARDGGVTQKDGVTQARSLALKDMR